MSNASVLAVHADTRVSLEAFSATPSHAVALIGSRGLGKTLLAKDIAAQLLGVTDTALTTYPYFRIITPQEGSISITQIRDILSFFTLTIPSKTKRAIARVLLVEDADMMTREAQNAFLKLLEEPPEDAVCILTLAKPQRLLATVRSRLQIIQIHKPSVEDVAELFHAQGIESTTVEKALMLSGGNIADAYKLLTSETGTVTDLSVELVKSTLASDTFTRLAAVDKLVGDRIAAERYVDTLILVAQASLHQAAQGDQGRLKRWQRVLQAAQTAQAALSKKGNTKLVFTELMLSM
jgi:hypothetical protein